MQFYAEYLLLTYLYNEVLLNHFTNLFFNYYGSKKKKVPFKVLGQEVFYFFIFYFFFERTVSLSAN